jgi:hypothetical protein
LRTEDGRRGDEEREGDAGVMVGTDTLRRLSKLDQKGVDLQRGGGVRGNREGMENGRWLGPRGSGALPCEGI